MKRNQNLSFAEYFIERTKELGFQIDKSISEKLKKNCEVEASSMGKISDKVIRKMNDIIGEIKDTHDSLFENKDFLPKLEIISEIFIDFWDIDINSEIFLKNYKYDHWWLWHEFKDKKSKYIEIGEFKIKRKEVYEALLKNIDYDLYLLDRMVLGCISAGSFKGFLYRNYRELTFHWGENMKGFIGTKRDKIREKLNIKSGWYWEEMINKLLYMSEKKLEDFYDWYFKEIEPDKIYIKLSKGFIMYNPKWFQKKI